jgi:hypothetical protein
MVSGCARASAGIDLLKKSAVPGFYTTERPAFEGLVHMKAWGAFLQSAIKCSKEGYLVFLIEDAAIPAERWLRSIADFRGA